jgi:hypothetical protein
VLPGHRFVKTSLTKQDVVSLAGANWQSQNQTRIVITSRITEAQRQGIRDWGRLHGLGCVYLFAFQLSKKTPAAFPLPQVLPVALA